MMEASEWLQFNLHIEKSKNAPNTLKSFLNESNLNRCEWYEDNVVNDYSQIKPVALAIGILLLTFAMVLKSFFIVYEKFEMDPMKRGFTNQMITNQFVWSLLLAFVLITNFILTLLSIDLPSCLSVILHWLITTCDIAIALIMFEATLFEYWSRLIIKRVPGYNIDFIAYGLMILNVVLSFYFGVLQLVAKSAPDPVLRIFRLIFIMLMILCVTFVVHKIIDRCKTRRLTVPYHLEPLEHAQSIRTTKINQKPNCRHVRRNKGEPKAVFLDRIKNNQEFVQNEKKDEVVLSPDNMNVINPKGQQQSSRQKKAEPFVIYVTSVNDDEEEDDGSVTICDVNQDRHYDPLEGTSKTIHRLLKTKNSPQILQDQLEVSYQGCLNNQRFNPDLLTDRLLNISLIGASTIFMLFAVFKISSEDSIVSFRKKYTGFIVNVAICFYHPFLLFIFNQKLRTFVLNQLTK